MSKQIILEALNGIRDEYVTEAGIKLGLLGAGAAATGAAGTAVDPSTLYSLSGTQAAAKAGFGAWLAKGGWVALAAGVLVAAGVATGAFLLGNSGDSGDTPPVGTGEVTTAEEESRFEEDESEETTEEITEDATEDTTEKETEGDTERDTQDETSNETHEPLRITSFAPEDTFSPLIIPDQSKLTYNEDGSLTALGKTSSTLYFHAAELMKLSPDYDETKAFVPHTILIKFARENCGINSPSTWVSDNTQGLMPEGVVCQYFNPEGYTYEYVLITVGDNGEFVEGSKPYVQFEWVNESASLASANRSITIYEISFYSSFTASMKGMGVLLAEEGKGDYAYEYGATQSGGGVLQGGLDEVQPIVTLPSTTPDGAPVLGIGQYCFRQNRYLHIVTVPEGYKRIEEKAFDTCQNLATIVLPDSLRVIESNAFNYCYSLTEVYIGSGIQYIASDAFEPYVTDIYYNGSIEDWRKVVCVPAEISNHDWRNNVTIHCTDGDYPALQEQILKEREQGLDLTDFLTTAAPIPLKEGQTVYRAEATTLTVYPDMYSPMEVILRWAIIEDTSHVRGLYYYFDILSPEDGRILGAMPAMYPGNTTYPYLTNAAMLLLDTDIYGASPTLTFLSYSAYNGTESAPTLNVASCSFTVTAKEDGTVSFNRYGGVEDSVRPGTDDTPLETKKMKVMSNLSESLATRDEPAYVLISSNPITDRAVYTVSDAPCITKEYADTLAAVTHAQFTELGLDGIYGEYGLCK